MFDPRVNPCVFTGYPYEKKAYKLLDLKTSKIVYSRDVTFHENHFPFHHNNTTNTSSYLSPPLPAPISPSDLDNIFLPTYTVHSSFSSFSTNSFIDHIFQSSSPPHHLSHTPDPDHISSQSLDFTISASPSIHLSSAPHPPPFNNPIPQVQGQPKRSTRVSKTPTYLNAYIHPHSKSNTALTTLPSGSSLNSHWCNLVSYSSLPIANQTQISHITSHHEPTSYLEASQHPSWVDAMHRD